MSVTICVARFDAPTSTGNTDFTTTDLGGVTPDGVLLFASGADTDNTAEAATNMGIGMADGTNEATVGCYMRDGNGTHESNHFHTNSQTSTLSTNVLFSEAEFVSFITNGVRLNFTDAPSSAHFITIVFFAGTDIAEIQVDTFGVANAQNGTASISTMGGTPDLVFCMGQRSPTPSESAPGGGRYSFGAAVNDGSETQRALAFETPRAVSTSSVNATTRNNRFHVCYFNQSVEWTAELTSFDSNGYTVTTRDGTSGARSISCMAIRFSGDTEAWVGDCNPPTSTGSDSITGVGFEPSFVLQAMSMLQTANSNITTGDAGAFGFSVLCTDEQHSNAWACEDNVGTENTQSLADNQAVRFTDDGGTETFAATFTSFDSDGWTQNYSAADSTARLWWGVAIGEAATATTLVADAGSYTWTGSSVDLDLNMPAGAGSYSWSGQDAGLLISRNLSAESGSYAWSGQDATFLIDQVLPADAGSYAWSGSDVTFQISQVITAEAGSYTWTGQDVNFLLGNTISAEPGSYAWTGQDATLRTNEVIDAEAGSYAWTGQPVNFALNMPADSGSYAWTGQDVTFIRSIGLNAEAGSYAWTGQDATLRTDKIIDAEAASYAWTGQDANFALVMPADAGSYAWSGQNVNFALTMPAAAGSYAWTGQNADLITEGALNAEPGSYTWTGQAATLIPPGVGPSGVNKNVGFINDVGRLMS